MAVHHGIILIIPFCSLGEPNPHLLTSGSITPTTKIVCVYVTMAVVYIHTHKQVAGLELDHYLIFCECCLLCGLLSING